MILDNKLNNLLDIDQLSKNDILYIFEFAEKLSSILNGPVKKVPVLRGKTIINYFSEPSTRTRVSFENAGKILSADVINVSSSGSSDEKGESFINAVQTLESIGADILIIRHSDSGAPYFVSRNIKIPVINAGDGSHAHPTQTLIDLYTVYKSIGEIEGLNLTILGDNIHSRVSRSAVLGFSTLGAKVTFCSPTTMNANFLSDNISKEDIDNYPAVIYTSNLKDALSESDLIMTLRTQFERKASLVFPNINEYTRLFKLSNETLRYAPDKAKILHPGPMNLGVEIDGYLSESERSLINQQVMNSVAIRMALLIILIGEHTLDSI